MSGCSSFSLKRERNASIMTSVQVAPGQIGQLGEVATLQKHRVLNHEPLRLFVGVVCLRIGLLHESISKVDKRLVPRTIVLQLPILKNRRNTAHDVPLLERIGAPHPV